MLVDHRSRANGDESLDDRVRPHRHVVGQLGLGVDNCRRMDASEASRINSTSIFAGRTLAGEMASVYKSRLALTGKPETGGRSACHFDAFGVTSMILPSSTEF